MLTFTGADESVSPKDLIKESFIEYGILFSQSRIGTPRYPKPEWVEELVKEDLNLAAHLCGYYVRNIFSNNYDFLNEGYFKYFKRIQINTKEVESLLIVAPRLAETYPERQFIIPVRDFRQFTLRIDNLVPLLDNSGGLGIKEVSWPEGLDIYCGYAGGIDPDNIKEVLNSIKCKNFWVDMETGLRDGMNFSIEKCRTIVKEYLSWRES